MNVMLTVEVTERGKYDGPETPLTKDVLVLRGTNRPLTSLDLQSQLQHAWSDTTSELAIYCVNRAFENDGLLPMTVTVHTSLSLTTKITVEEYVDLPVEVTLSWLKELYGDLNRVLTCDLDSASFVHFSAAYRALQDKICEVDR